MDFPDPPRGKLDETALGHWLTRLQNWGRALSDLPAQVAELLDLDPLIPGVTRSDAITWLTSLAVPVIQIGHLISVAGANVIAIGDQISSTSGVSNVLIGDVRKLGGADNVVIGYGNTSIGDGFADNTVIGKDALVGGAGANATENCLITNSGSIAAGVDGATGVGFGIALGHDRAVLLGKGAASDAADKMRVFLNSAVALEMVHNPASGETGMYLICHNGTSLAVRQVTLAASSGGQRALQVAG